MINKKNKQKAKSLYLVMTKQCNLRCSYCLEQPAKGNCAPKSGSSLMSIETAKKAIDIFWEMFSCDKDTMDSTITFYGGESLLNWPVIKESLEYIRELDKNDGIETTAMINTNGTLITKKIAQEAKNYNLIFIVSLDGLEAINDKYRGKGSFDRIIKGLNILKEEGIKTLLSVVLTPSNFDGADDLLEIAQRFGIKEMVASPLMGDTIKHILNSADIKEYAQNAAVSAVDYFKKAQKSSIEELRIKAREKSFISGIPVLRSTDVGCLMYGDQIVVWPSSKISLCEHMEDLSIGTTDTPVAELIKNKNKLVEKLKKRLPVFNKECRGCKRKKICEGGCAFSARCITGDLTKKDLLSCAYFQKLYELLGKQQK